MKDLTPIQAYIKENFSENSCELMRDLNLMLVPCVKIPTTEAGMKEFNHILELSEESGLENVIEFSRSGGVTVRRDKIRRGVGLRVLSSVLELVIVDFPRCIRFQFRSESPKKGLDISGRKAFSVFKKICRRFGVDLEDYAIEDGEEIKKQIPAPLIGVIKAKLGVLYEGCHHIDFHSAYMGALAETGDPFRMIVDYIYNKREKEENEEKKNEWKAVLTNTFGYMQSKIAGYRWAHFSLEMIKRTREKLLDLSERLRESGRIPLFFNTDGIWYAGEIYHGEGEGKKAGEWENNHENAKIYFKSPGCYAFEENGVFKPVCKGRYKFDSIKPRDKWTWEDFFKLDEYNTIEFAFVPGKGKLGRIVQA